MEYTNLMPTRKLAATMCLTLGVIFGSAGLSESAEIYKALIAAQNGDLPTALHRWKRLADQGNDFAH